MWHSLGSLKSTFRLRPRSWKHDTIASFDTLKYSKLDFPINARSYHDRDSYDHCKVGSPLNPAPSQREPSDVEVGSYNFDFGFSSRDTQDPENKFERSAPVADDSTAMTMNDNSFTTNIIDDGEILVPDSPHEGRMIVVKDLRGWHVIVFVATETGKIPKVIDWAGVEKKTDSNKRSGSDTFLEKFRF